MIHINFSHTEVRLKKVDGKTYVYDVVRRKWLVLTPEEHVRQMFLQYLIHEEKYPAALIAVEKKIAVGQRAKRFDAVVFNKSHQPWMLIECKEPSVELTQEVLFQLLNYQRAVQCRYWLITNGHQTYCADANDVENIVWLTQLPFYEP